ncbi:MAG: cobalamin/Fe(3+)-siderophore ABC transporter ATP-binding protein [Desulfuromonas sp.]|nr:MAG: cobalamin/Fe(3+)-siderophore ABC transporter ATP-binding protein [Desulfuromonas sp.]
MIRAEGLSFSYPAGEVFCQLNLEISAGEVLALVGPNGCGKSTFLKLLRGVLKPSAGQVFWEGRPVSSLSRREMAQRVAVVAQSHEIFFAYTVRELVAMGRYPHCSLWGGLSRADHERIEQVLEMTDIVHLATRPATDLSGGELQRVMLARALVQQTDVLLLDEATSHLDLIHRLTMSDLLQKLNREQGTTIVQVLHDLDLAAQTSHRVLMFSATGAVAAIGAPGEVLTADNIRSVFGVEVEVGVSPVSGVARIFPIRPARSRF